jgi:hypothetical protein
MAARVAAAAGAACRRAGVLALLLVVAIGATVANAQYPARTKCTCARPCPPRLTALLVLIWPSRVRVPPDIQTRSRTLAVI